MKYIIDTEVCEKEGISMDTLFALLLIKSSDNIPKLFKSLEEDKIIFKDMFNNYTISSKYDDLTCNILLNSDISVPQDTRIDILTDKLREIFPKGKKGGSVYYWRDNRKCISLRLKKWFKLFGDKYTDEQIIEATKKYVTSFNGDYTYMKLLKYFIWKDTKKEDSDGNIYIEQTSELLSYLENEDVNSITSNWINELK